jgi:hypothetical protein
LMTQTSEPQVSTIVERALIIVERASACDGRFSARSWRSTRNGAAYFFAAEGGGGGLAGGIMPFIRTYSTIWP